MAKQKVAMLTAGGLAPCLSSAVGGLIERYTDIAPDIELVAYRSGYQGLLLADRIEITRDMREKAHILHRHGGSPIGNSRVKLTNTADCIKRGLVKEGQNPLRVAAERLAADGITILHTIGGDDTNTTAADLAAYLGANGTTSLSSAFPRPSITTSYRSASRSAPGRQPNTAPSSSTMSATNRVPHRARSSCMKSGPPLWLADCGAARSYIQHIDDREFVDGFMMNRQMKNIDGLYLPETAFKSGSRIPASARHHGQDGLRHAVRFGRRLPRCRRCRARSSR